MRLSRRPGISLKLSALVTLLLMAELVLLSLLLDVLGPEYRTVTLLTFLGGTLVMGLLFAWGLDVLVTRPLISLVNQVRELSDRGYGRPFEVLGTDEPRELGRALEQLRQQVVSRENELQRLNQELEARVEARTEQLREAQAQLVEAEKLASVGELAGGVAHEVNNPTGVILARGSYLVGVADDEGFDPDVIDDLEVIVHQAKRIRTITGDLLSFARHSDPARVEVDLVEVCELTLNLLSHMARRSDVEMILETPERAVIMGSRDGLEQMVFNFVKNAVQATGEGGRVRVTVRDPGADEPLVLTVDDTGEGVPEDIRGRIFDPFFTTKPVGEGTGLGLSVVYGIVSDHEGTIVVEDSPEGGARFRVVFPPHLRDPGAAPYGVSVPPIEEDG